jgi:hypothetical protein
MKLIQPLILLGFAGIACHSAQSQSALQPDTRLPGGFGALSNVVELSDGRVVFADTKGKLFLRGDFKSGRVDTLGRRVDSLGIGSAAGHYKFPGWVAHLAGDTVALVDFSALRTTLWNEAGQPLRVLALQRVSGNTPVLLYDTLGHGYKIDYQAVLGGGEPGRAIRPDSIPVLRLALAEQSVDTVAQLSSPEYGDAIFGEEVQQAAKVFAPNDFFGVLPDGTAWVARARLNRVDWRAPDGTWTRGEPRDYARVPVTEADKQRVLAQVRQQGKQYGMPQDLRVVYPFAETKPPFEHALGRPGGEVWLQRPRASEDAPLTYDVWNRKGKWTREVRLPAGATLAGFGANGVVYAAIKNSDETRTIGRFRLSS